MNWIRTIAVTFVLGLAASSASIAATTNPCSSWSNTMGIAFNMGGAATLINTKLSNGADFVFHASTTDDVVAFTVDHNGVKVLKDWDEDSDGTAKLEDDAGQTCTVACDGNGGITITISGTGFTTLTWNVQATGVIQMAGDVCGCSGSANAPTQNRVCDLVACQNTSACRPNNAGYCQNCSAPN